MFSTGSDVKIKLIQKRPFATIQKPWQNGHMGIRLSVATLGVAALAYIWSPLGTMVVFTVFVGSPVVWGAWISEKDTFDHRPSIPPTFGDDE